MSLLNKIDSIQKEFLSELSSATKNSSQLSNLYNKYLGRKGLVSDLFSELSKVDSNVLKLFSNVWCGSLFDFAACETAAKWITILGLIFSKLIWFKLLLILLNQLFPYPLSMGL